MDTLEAEMFFSKHWRTDLTCVIILKFFFIPVTLFADSSAGEAQDTVILVHGLGRTANSMLVLKYRLEKAGYHVVSESYPSTTKKIQEHSEWLQNIIDQSIKDRPGTGKVHFVTHSMGGIIIRCLFAARKPDNLGRVVMLSPPNAGSEIVDFLKEHKLFQNLLGPSGQQLGTDAKSIPQILGPVDFELGIITGNVSYSPISSLFITGEHDGKVSIESAKIEGMSDFLIVHTGHTFIVNSTRVGEQVTYFLKYGKFIHTEEESVK